MTTLELHREGQSFNSEEYINQKVRDVNSYLLKYDIECVVLGVSGGIDSALTYRILEKVKELGQLKRIIPVHIAFTYKGSGVENQKENKLRCDSLFGKNENYLSVVFSEPTFIEKLHMSGTYNDVGGNDSNWVSGQLNYMLRTPIFYQVASAQKTLGFNSIVCGTTNKSEGSYIGYFGKFSDMAVDIQIISDLYKSQVFEVSRYLGVSDSVINRTPKGDVLGDLTDEELMGFTYDNLELYLREREANPEINPIDSSVPFEVIEAIEDLNRINKHKYFGGYQSVFVINDDIRIKGGWNLKKFDIDNY